MVTGNTVGEPAAELVMSTQSNNPPFGMAWRKELVSLLAFAARTGDKTLLRSETIDTGGDLACGGIFHFRTRVLADSFAQALSETLRHREAATITGALARLATDNTQRPQSYPVYVSDGTLRALQSENNLLESFLDAFKYKVEASQSAASAGQVAR